MIGPEPRNKSGHSYGEIRLKKSFREAMDEPH